MSTVIRSRDVKIRKPRKCVACLRKYEPGTVMQVVTFTDAGEIADSYWCDDCQEYYSLCDFNIGEDINKGEFTNDPEYWEWLKTKEDDL